MRGKVAAGTLLAVGLSACGGVHDVSSVSSEVVVCPDHGTVEGIDVSYYQGTIDWLAVKQSGREFAFIRVSDGVGFLDPRFDANWSGARAAGMVRGAYQFFRPGQNPMDQANLLLQRMGALGAGDLPPVLDVEVMDGQPSSVITNGIRVWVDRVTAVTGRTPFIYTSPGFWNQLTGTSSFANIPLWVAHWGVTCPNTPNTWNYWRFWQYSSNGTVPGISGRTDIDRFNGTLAELQALASAGEGGGLASLGGNVAGGLVAGPNADGRLEVFARSYTGTVTTAFQRSPGGGFSGWYSLGGNIVGTPALVNNADGRMELFARAPDGAIWHAYQAAPNGSFGAWSSLGGNFVSDAASAINADGRLQIFASAADGLVYSSAQVAPGGGWSGWVATSGIIGGGLQDPRATSRLSGALVVFARGADGGVYASEQTDGGWTDWAALGNVIEGAVAPAVNADGRLEIFARGADGALWYDVEVSPGGGFAGWASLGGAVYEPAVFADVDGRLEVFVRGADGNLYRIRQTSNGGWEGFTSMNGQLEGAPAVTSNLDGRLEVFIRAPDSSVGHAWQSSPGAW